MPNTPAEPVGQRPAHRMGLMLIGIGMRAAALARLRMQLPMVTRALAIRRHAPRRG